MKWAAGLVLTVFVSGEPARAGDSGASHPAIRGTDSAGVLARRAKALLVFKKSRLLPPAARDETLLIGAGGGLKNAAVLLRPIGKVSVDPRPWVLDNQRCAFVPHVQIAVGSELLPRITPRRSSFFTTCRHRGKSTLNRVSLSRARTA